MSKREEESEAKKLKDENDLSRARDFINSVEYPKRINTNDSEFWYYQLHNRMKFNQLMVGIIAEQHINDENWSLLKASKVLNDEQILQLESSKQLNLEMYQSIRDSNQFCGDVMDDFAYNMPSDSYLMGYLTEEFKTCVTDVNFMIYPDKRDNISDKYCPVKSISIKDISVTNALIGTSKKYGAMYEKTLDATKALINANNKSKEALDNQQELKLDTVEDHILKEYLITDNCDFDDSIDDIVTERSADEDPRYAYIRIDTTCPTKQLEVYFKQWLKENDCIDSAIIKDDITLKTDKFCTKKILQIWDLNMWCTINNVSLKKKDFKDTIFPDHIETMSYRTYKRDYFDECFERVFIWDNVNQLNSLIHRKRMASLKAAS